MGDKFKEFLKENGQSLKWFYNKFIKKETGLTYSGFTAQLNDYAPITETVRKQLLNYMSK